MNEEILRVDEAARKMRVSEETVRRLLRSGKLRGVRPGSTKMGWRVYGSSVDLWLSGNTQLELPGEQGKRAA
jgi:excisionase family DNA binding protein